MPIPHTVRSHAKLAYRLAMMRGIYSYKANRLAAEVYENHVKVWDIQHHWFVPIAASWL